MLGKRAVDARWRKAALDPMPAEGSRLVDFSNVRDDPVSRGILHELAGRKLPADWILPE